MFQKAVHIFIILSLFALAGCGKAVGGEEGEVPETAAVLYENPDQGIRVLEAGDWIIEKETATSVKFTNDKIVAIISVIPKGETVAEIKQGFLSAAGEVIVTGEGPNFISWKTERNESIHTNVYIDEKKDRNVITSFLTPLNVYETNREKIEAFRWNIELY